MPWGAVLLTSTLKTVAFRTIAYVVGARPNFVKMAPVLKAMRRRARGSTHVLIHTGQHFDAQMSDVFLDELRMPAPDYVLDVRA